MNELITKENIKIENLVYEIRGVQVMFDSDLARLYECKNGTKEINQAVKRNFERFPSGFYFQLTNDEYKIILRSQFVTAKYNNMSRSLPYVFTEEGVAMLTTVLKSKVAAKTSVQIMDAFVAMRHYISNGALTNNIEHKLLDHDNRIRLLENTFDGFKEKNNHIFFEGQIYDSFSLLLDIFESSKKSIVIIDNYTDKKLLDILSKTKKEVTVYSKNYNKELIEKYKGQYNNVILKENNSFHDRFIIIDECILYHCGASFKDLGSKCFCISKIEDNNYLKEILKRII